MFYYYPFLESLLISLGSAIGVAAVAALIAYVLRPKAGA